MPRIIDPALSMVLERANPQTCYFTEVNAPDVARVLRRPDEFIPPLSQSPADSLAADPAGALTMASTPSTVASFTSIDDAAVNLNVTNPSPKDFRGLRWKIDPQFGRAVLKTFSAKIRRAGLEKNNLALQIYRVQGEPVEGTPLRVPIFGTIAPAVAVKYSFVPLLHAPIIWKHIDGAWSAGRATVTFDLTKDHFEFGNSNIPQPSTDTAGEENAYYFVITPVGASSNDIYFWDRDRTSSRVVAGVGTFEDVWWRRTAETDAFAWRTETITPAVPVSTVAIESYATTAQAVYALTLPAVPQASSVGAVVFESGLPTGTAATFELSTAGTGGPWTVMKHGDEITVKQLTYHARVTLTSNTSHRLAPRVAALGVEFRIPVDLTAEAIVEPIAHEVEVPFLKSGVGEGRATAVRFGRRDYRDAASDLASQYPSSKLEVDVFLGSRHPLVTRDRWLHIDRAMVNNREPSQTAETLGILSYLKTLKRKIPKNIESVNVVMHVASASTTSITTVDNLPEILPGYYIRVRSSSAAGFTEGNYTREIDGDPQTSGPKTLQFDPSDPLPGTLAAGNVIEIHSASYLALGLRWEDEDPADVWMEVLSEHLLIPLERIGRGDLGRVSRGGLPPRVEDRAPGDPDTQAKLKVTLQTKEPESADELIDQLSFIMGGVTTEIAGQIVFRQVYPLRDPEGEIVVPADPVAATFDTRNTAGLNTPTGLQERITQISANYGVNTTAVSEDEPPAQTVVAVDVDAMVWLEDQEVDDLAPATIPDEIARWCYNSTDGGLYLASVLAQQVVRAGSTGLRVWSWAATEQQPQLVVGDRVAIITDQYTDYDPARRVAIRGWWAYQLALISVQGGGTRFRGFMLGLADAVQIKGGEGELAIDEGTDRSEILNVTWQDSEDGKTRDYDVIAGSAVQTIHVHHRLWPVGTQGDPYDFEADQHVHDDRNFFVRRPDESDGHFRFTLPHPFRGYQRAGIIVPRQGPPSLAFGREHYKFFMDPAPQAMSAKIQATVTDATADVEVEVIAGVSDWPVVVRVYEGAPDTAPLLVVSLSAGATLDKISHPTLGARPLPLGEIEAWYVKLTNVAGEEEWFGPETADRDPLASGTVTIDDYRGDPLFRIVVDTNTDVVKITVPDGRTKTYDRAAIDAFGGPVLYDVGDDLLDDLSTETDLGVDETREPYKVEIQGGGTWTTIFDGALHGEPSSPPTAKIRQVKNTDGSTEDLFVTPDSPSNEKIRVFYRDGDSDLAPTYGLVVSAGDSTPLYVTRGTEVGPANFFQITGVGSPSAKLGGIALTQDQIKPIQIGLKGQDSGIENWIPVVLSLLDKPYNESVAVDWDDAAGELVVTVVAGAKVKSNVVQVADNDAFTSPDTESVDMDTGDTEIVTFPLSGADRGKTWYGRATPWNKVGGTGLPGDPQMDSVVVPALFTWEVHTTEPSGNAFVDITIDDPGGVLDPASVNHSITGALHWELLKNGVRTYLASTATPSGSTSGSYTLQTALDPKHPIQIAAYAHLVDGSTQDLGSWTFDANKISDVTASVAYAGATALVTAKFDTDTATGAAGARYRIDGGSWVDFSVNATTLIGTFSVTASPTAKQVVDVQGKNALDGNYGNSVTIEVDKYSVGPSISATFKQLTSSTGQVIWNGVGTITLSIDNGTPATPSASPIAVTLDGTTHTYLFEATDFTNQKNSVAVTVPALSATAVAFSYFGGAANGSTDEVVVSWATNVSVHHFNLQWHFAGTDWDDPSTATDMGTQSSPFHHAKTGTGGHGYAIAATPLPPDGHQIDYFVQARDAAGNVLASTGWFGVAFKVGV